MTVCLPYSSTLSVETGTKIRNKAGEEKMFLSLFIALIATKDRVSFPLIDPVH